MPRVTFSNELNDFIKAFGVGSEIVQNAQEHKLKQDKVKKEAELTDAHINYYNEAAKSLGNKTKPLVDEADKDEWLRHNSPQASNDDRDLLIRTIYGEGGGEGPEGQTAIANVIKNRLAMGKWGHSLRDVIMAPKQFSLWNPGDPAGEKARKLSPEDPAYKSIGAIVDKVLRGEGSDLTGGATHYYNPHVANPDWAGGLAKQNDVTIGNHRFVGRYVGGSAIPVETDASPPILETGAVPMQAGACGGMIKRYASGGMVRGYAEGGAVQYNHNYADPYQHRADEDNDPNDADDKPYYASNLASDVENALGNIGEVIKGGLHGLQDRFGLNERPAVAQADPGYQNRILAFARNEGAPPPQQIEEAKKVVNPRGELDDSLATTYAMVKAYQHHLANGDVKSAQQAAAAFLLYTKERSQQFGALAATALQNGDQTAGKQALMHAFNIAPNGQQVKIEGNKAIVFDQASGKPVKEIEMNPEFMFKAAMGLADGSAYLQNMMEVAGAGKAGVSDEEFERRASPYNDGAVPATSAPPAASAPPAPGAPQTAPSAAQSAAPPAAPATPAPAPEGQQPPQAVPTEGLAAFSEAPPPAPDFRGLSQGQKDTLRAEHRRAIAEWKARKESFDQNQRLQHNEAVHDANETKRLGLSTRAPHHFDLANPENLNAVDDALGWTGNKKAPEDPAMRDGIRSLVGSLKSYNPGISLPLATTALAVMMYVPKDEKDQPFTIEKGDEAYGTVRFKFKDTRLPPVSVPRDALDALVTMRGIYAQQMAAQSAKAAKREKANSDLYSW